MAQMKGMAMNAAAPDFYRCSSALLITLQLLMFIFRVPVAASSARQPVHVLVRTGHS